MKVMRKIVVGLVFLLGFVINFHFGNNSVSADNIDRYIAYVGQSQDSYGMPIYVQNLSTGKVDVAYCINESKKLPYSAVYNRFDATPERLMALDNPLVDREQLPDIIKRIIYNGYPLNATKLQGKLSDGAFRRLTQLAIWHYSDSYNVNENELTQEERMVYNELIQSVNPVPVNLNLNIYVKDDSTYQDLLGTSFGQLPEHPQFSSSSSVSSSSSSKPSSSSSSSSIESSSSSVSSSSSSSSSSSVTKAESTSSSSSVSSSSSISSSVPQTETSTVSSSSPSLSSSSSVTKAESTSSSSSSSSEQQESSSSSSVPSSSSSSSVESSNVSSTSSVSSSSSSEQTSKVSSEQSSSSSSEISSVPSVATSTSSSSSTNSEKMIPVETSSSSSKKELVSKKVNSSVKVDKKKDLPQTGEKHNEVLWLSILGCIVLAGSLWIFERKYK
ncbi:Cys-Gln thioester bond-forming surface protein [Ligilactobacillus salivarius]|uniref:Cys-Gln thioester bond-forming surface protein n=2 Tax=Ligilactobacillus salivarius TaxID=1624 RepID=UPI0011CCA225|nr:Cys-Gln thioester bond-forming surface protein [Ligilactobacillus salivarius]MBX0284083.1 thioester-forming surface-anchored protein [Ligilactobacillus salivarius]MCR4914002.1 Cys-Gln thioester bond-forming surface protein [Lactobacillus sp.]MYU75307.1 thioester-forming surface-anchored protein [Ligilactobacillus salivarius]TXJ81229.1 thioester-forming surface-anchored protein [Ligilactobacillus salivarius]